jgi:cell division protein FtsI/penicillin-binding protein 2
VLSLAGIAYSAPQPPGSTFKIITLSGVLENRVVKSTATFPVQTSATLEGVELENANGESCGGTLANSFAHSCNSVFAPLGARLGADKLVKTAEAFGFNETPSLKGAQPSTIPGADAIGDDLAVGSTAIGQGVVQSTPLGLASVAATIGNRGIFVRPTLLKRGETRRTRAISARTARTVDRFMRLVVKIGTGVGAQIAGVTVAGKTGTAELRDTTPDPTATPDPGLPPPVVDDRTDTDAWFVAYAPAKKPRVAVAVLLVGEGAGGETAAPVAREILLRALKKRF